MERYSPTSMEDSKDGCHCSRCGGQSTGDSSKEALGEAWFKNENSTAERKSLMRLERELEAALSFEHGDREDGGPRVHPIWITCILLGRLFQERQALGKAVKLYACFQRREFMRSLVKINDLEDQAETPLSGTVGTSSLANYKGEAMDVEESVDMQEEVRLAEQLNLGGDHGGTNLPVG